MNFKVALKDGARSEFFTKKMHQRVNRSLWFFRLTIVLPSVGKRSGNGSRTLSQDGYGRVTFRLRDYAGDCSPTRCFERPFSIISVMQCNASNASFESCPLLTTFKKRGARHSATGNTMFRTCRSSQYPTNQCFDPCDTLVLSCTVSMYNESEGAHRVSVSMLA
jgi:hypothetical protein